MSDWDTVTILKKKAPKASTLKSEQAVNAARRQGQQVDTQQKWGAGSNKQHVAAKNTAKLDRETEELRHDTIPLEVGKLIQQGRQAKNMSQKDLATRINEKPQVITDYEAGRGIPNNNIIGKIERVIGIKLRALVVSEIQPSHVDAYSPDAKVVRGSAKPDSVPGGRK